MDAPVGPSHESFAPRFVAGSYRLISGTYDIGKEHGCQVTVRLGASPNAGEKTFDLIRNRICTSAPWEMICPANLNQFRSWDRFAEVAAMPNRHYAITGRVHDQRRYVNGG